MDLQASDVLPAITALLKFSEHGSCRSVPGIKLHPLCLLVLVLDRSFGLLSEDPNHPFKKLIAA